MAGTLGPARSFPGLEVPGREARTPFDSTAIRDIRYEHGRCKLFVTFTNGGDYVYLGAPGELHRGFVEAESQGRFFVDEIRDRFPFNRLDSQGWTPGTCTVFGTCPPPLRSGRDTP